MSEYMSSLFITCAVISVCSMLSYRERRDFSTRFAFGTLIIYVALLPIVKFVSFGGGELSFDLEFDVGDYSEDYKSVAEEAFCEGVGRLISEKYGLKREAVFVLAEGFDFESMSAEKIRVILSDTAAFADYKGIEKYINEQGLGRCNVEIEIG